MVEAVNLDKVISIHENITEELVLEQILSKLFLHGEVEFFDAESDEEFLRILDNSGKTSAEEQRSALDDFIRDLGLGNEFETEFARMGEIVVNSDDFEEHNRIPLLVFTLSSGGIFADRATASFGIESLDVICSGNESFAIVLNVRNTADSHMEIYLRLTKQEALNVVGTILRVFEGCTRYTEGGTPRCFSLEDEHEGSLIDQAQADCCPIPACHSFKFHEKKASDPNLPVEPQYFN